MVCQATLTARWKSLTPDGSGYDFDTGCAINNVKAIDYYVTTFIAQSEKQDTGESFQLEQKTTLSAGTCSSVVIGEKYTPDEIQTMATREGHEPKIKGKIAAQDGRKSTEQCPKVLSGSKNKEEFEKASFVASENVASELALLSAIEYPIIFLKFPIEDIPSLVTEIVGNDEPDDEIEKKGSGIFVICVGTTEKSAKGGPTECKGKLSAFMKDGNNSASASLEQTILFLTIVERENISTQTECGQVDVGKPSEGTADTIVLSAKVHLPSLEVEVVCPDMGKEITGKRFCRGLLAHAGKGNPHRLSKERLPRPREDNKPPVLKKKKSIKKTVKESSDKGRR